MLALRSSALAEVTCAVGFQLVDGKERIIVVEGLAEGAMQALQDIALQSLDGTIPQPANTRPRAVHWHQSMRYRLGSDCRLESLLHAVSCDIACADSALQGDGRTLNPKTPQLADTWPIARHWHKGMRQGFSSCLVCRRFNNVDTTLACLMLQGTSVRELVHSIDGLVCSWSMLKGATSHKYCTSSFLQM